MRTIGWRWTAPPEGVFVMLTSTWQTCRYKLPKIEILTPKEAEIIVSKLQSPKLGASWLEGRLGDEPVRIERQAVIRLRENNEYEERFGPQPRWTD